MPTWKKKDDQGKLHFQFLCDSCNLKKEPLLAKDEWVFVREGDPASCNDCALQCALTAGELWGAEDRLRYEVCEHCAAYAACELKGRYYC